MSRIGKKIINIPDKVEVFLTDEKSGDVSLRVKGPLGEVIRNFKRDVVISIDGKEVKLSPSYKSKFTDALWGTYGSHILNMVDGVTKGFSKKLVIEGVGYKAALSGDKMVFSLGFSHPVEIKIPVGLKVTVEKNVISISGVDKDLVGHFASVLVANKKPEPYKGKGIRYEGQVIKIKQGKKSVA